MTDSTYPGVVWWWCWPASLVSVLGWGQQRTVARQTFCEEQPSHCSPAQPAPARSITTDVRGHAIKIKWTFGRDFISPPAEPQLGILGDMEWRREREWISAAMWRDVTCDVNCVVVVMVRGRHTSADQWLTDRQKVPGKPSDDESYRWWMLSFVLSCGGQGSIETLSVKLRTKPRVRRSDCSSEVQSE